MLSLSHPAAASAVPRHRRAPRHATAPSRRRATHIAASAILLPGGGGPGDRKKLPFTPPPMAPPGRLYRPFHPPPSPLPPSYRTLDLTQRLEVLRDRMGRWEKAG